MKLNGPLVSAFKRWCDYTGQWDFLAEHNGERFVLIYTGESGYEHIHAWDDDEEIILQHRTNAGEDGYQSWYVIDLAADSFDTALRECSYEIRHYIVDHQSDARRILSSLGKCEESGQETLI